MLSISNYFKSLIFYIESKKLIKENEILLSVICAYYSIFHLSVSRIKLFKGHKFEPEMELDKIFDKSKGLRHSTVQNLIKTLIEQKKLCPEFYDILVRLEELRNYVNYGPRLYYEKGEYVFDTCSNPNIRSEMEKIIKHLDKSFYYYLDSLMEIEHNPFFFTDVYKNFYIDGYRKMNFCPDNILDEAVKYHDKLFAYHEKRRKNE